MIAKSRSENINAGIDPGWTPFFIPAPLPAWKPNTVVLRRRLSTAGPGVSSWMSQGTYWLSFCPSMIMWLTEQRGGRPGGWGLRRWRLCFINTALSWGAQKVPTNCCSFSAVITFMSQTICTSSISLKAWNGLIKSPIPPLTSPKACSPSTPFVLDPAGDILYSNQLPHSPIGSEQTQDVAWTCFRLSMMNQTLVQMSASIRRRSLAWQPAS